MGYRNRSRFLVVLLFPTIFLVTGSPRAMSADWPQFLGPSRNGISTETGWTTDWSEGPPILWQASIGTGFSPVCVTGECLFTMGFEDGQESVLCLETKTGEEIWRYSYPADPHAFQHEGGPCGSPTVSDGSVFAFGKDGQLVRLSATDGKLIWRKNLPKELGVKVHELGFTGSPWVSGDRLFLDVGPVVAFKVSDGGLLWRSRDYPIAFASVIPFDFQGRLLGASMNHLGLVIFDLSNGTEVAHHDLATFDGVNVASPIISGSSLFVSAGYDQGCELLGLTATGQLKSCWKNQNMRNHFSNSVLWEENLYGFDGNVNRQGQGELRCLSLRTGEVSWSEPSVTKGSLIIAGGKILALTGDGELVCAEASSEGYHELARSQVLGGKSWTLPVLSNGRVYCRNSEGTLVCVDVRGSKVGAGEGERSH
jgi:outer membrane protein assembly factor BamB